MGRAYGAARRRAMTFEVKILAVSHPLLTSEVIVRLCGAGHLPATAIRPVARLRRIGLHTAQRANVHA
jgi:hypothetical protein